MRETRDQTGSEREKGGLRKDLTRLMAALLLESNLLSRLLLLLLLSLLCAESQGKRAGSCCQIYGSHPVPVHDKRQSYGWLAMLLGCDPEVHPRWILQSACDSRGCPLRTCVRRRGSHGNRRLESNSAQRATGGQAPRDALRRLQPGTCSRGEGALL